MSAEMVARGLDQWGETASFRQFTATSGDRVTGGSSAPTYAAAAAVKAMPFTATEQDAGGGSAAGKRIIIGGAELVAAGITEVKGQDKVILGGVDHQIATAEAVRAAGEILYFDARTTVR